MLRSEIPSGMCAELRTGAASNNRNHPTRSLYCCLFAPHTYIFVLRAHLVRGESHNQRNTTGEVATLTWRHSYMKFANMSRKTTLCGAQVSYRRLYSYVTHNIYAIMNLLGWGAKTELTLSPGVRNPGYTTGGQWWRYRCSWIFHLRAFCADEFDNGDEIVSYLQLDEVCSYNIHLNCEH